MKTHLLMAATAVALAFAGVGQASAQIAQDNADDPVYDDGWDLSDNGGFGFPAGWQEFAGGGGRFLQTNDRRVEGSRSFGLFPGDQTGSFYGVTRFTDVPLTGGVFSVLARHDLNAETGFSGFNLADNPAGTFDAGEIIRFGLQGATPGSGLGDVTVTGSDGAKTLTPTNDGEIRGDVLQYVMNFDTIAGTYTLVVNNLTEGASDSESGTIGNAAVHRFGVANFNTGSFQDLIFDVPTFAIPEPTSLGLATMASLALLRRRR